MKQQYLQTGKIVSTHGVRGEVKLLPWADSPEFLLQFDTLWIGGRAYRVESSRVLRMKPYPALLAELLSEELSSLRQQKALTQEAMAEQLRISSRAYSDLERGRYAASAPTLLFLFSMLEADAQSALVRRFMNRVQAPEGTDAA